MSLYGTTCKIGGVPCAMVLRGTANGQYQAVFEREYAALENIEAIDWDQPAIEGSCVLPAGYGFTVEDISYNSANRSYTVTIQTAAQHLGDVTGYQALVAELTDTVAAKETVIQSQAAVIAELESQPDGGAVLEQLAAAYEEGVESNG